MTGDKCGKCGKKVRPKQAATITQWLNSANDCNCEAKRDYGSISTAIESTEKAIRCPACGKDRTISREGSLTQWIFQDAKCQCDWEALGIEMNHTPVSGTYLSEPIDPEVKAVLESGQIDHHGLSQDAFPFDRYRIVREIDRGGGGVVFKCWDMFLKKRVAIKMLHGKTWSAEELVRLQNEARASSKISHPNVVRVLDFGSSSGGQPYLVMEFVNGQTLQEVMRDEGPLDELTALSIFSQVLAGIGNAHKHGILHRDVKPGNIIVIDALSESPQAKVIDFGIAALTKDEEKSTTASGNAIPAGSPAYMSPEQARSEAFTPASDIYSLGCVFYEALSGVNPFRGHSVLDSISRHANLEPAAISDVLIDRPINQDLEQVVRKMLEKDPKMRFQSAEEVREEIDALLDRKEKEGGGARVKRRGTSSTDEEKVFAGTALGARRRGPDPMLYAIGAAGLMFILSIVLLVMDRAGEVTLSGEKSAETPKASLPATLDDEITKPSYIEDILMPNSKRNDDYLKSLEKGAQLPEELNLRMSEVTDTGINYIKDLPIRFLDLSYTGITDKSLEYISHMSNLGGIYLTGTEVTADGIKHLTKLKTLRFIDLSAVPQDTETLRALAHIEGLNRLYLIGSPGINKQTIQELKASKTLENLAFRRIALGHEEALEISKLKSLRSLLLSYCELTDEDLPALKNLQKLSMLDLSGNHISDDGLMVLSQFKNLRELYIAHCSKITARGLERFKRAHGKCAVRLELGPTILGSSGSL